MISEEAISYCSIIVFVFMIYPLVTLFIAKKDERQLGYFLDAVKTSTIITTFILGLIFIIYVSEKFYYAPIALIISVIDLEIIVLIILYYIQLNTEIDYQRIFSKLDNSKIIRLRNICVTFTIIFFMLNYKNKFLLNYKVGFLIGAYIFFFLSCYFGSKVSYSKIKR